MLRQYFNSMLESVVRHILKAIQERQVNFKADVLVKLSQIGVATLICALLVYLDSSPQTGVINKIYNLLHHVLG